MVRDQCNIWGNDTVTVASRFSMPQLGEYLCNAEERYREETHDIPGTYGSK